MNARLIDGTGAPPRDNQSVLLNGKHIVAVGAEAEIRQTHDVRPDVASIDLRGQTLLPGFIDAHVHILWNPDPAAPPPIVRYIPVRDAAYWKARSILYGVQAVRMTLEAGFTTVRDLGNPNDAVFALRDSIDTGETFGARLRASGMCITHTGGHGTEGGPGDFAIVADGPDEVFKAVRKQIVAGADVIKFMGGTRPALSPPFRGRQGYTTEEMIPGVEEAHRAGLRVAAHAHSSIEGIKNCIRAGVNSVEHGYPLDDEAAGMMAERGTYLCPTLSVTPAALKSIEAGTWTYKGSEEMIKKHVDWGPRAIEAAKKAGVKIALGTDAAMPGVMHGGNAYEFELLVEYGLSPLEALICGTRNAAENIGMFDSLGTIGPGKLADLVVIDGDPLTDIRILQQMPCITLVFKEGVIAVDRRPARV